MQIGNIANQMMNSYMNNQMQNIMGQLEIQLKQMNPKGYQLYQLARQQNADPRNIVKQITANFDEATMQQFRQGAKQFGITDDILNQI